MEPNPATPCPPPAAPREAWILLDPATAGLRVAALPVLDRLLVALHRAGWERILVVGAGDLPRLPRSEAWKIAFSRVDHPPRRAGPTLVVRSDTLVETADARRLRAHGGPVRLAGRDGQALPAAVLPPGDGDPEVTLEALPRMEAAGVTGRVRDSREAGRRTSELWASIVSGSDGMVDRAFNRPVGRPLSRLLVHTPATPNAISVTATLVGLVAAGLFALGDPGWSIVAALVFQFSAILDCVDGDVARAVFKESRLGKWLDLVGDQVVHLGVFGGIACGLATSGGGAGMGWLGVAAMAGAALSFVMVLRGGRLARQRGVDDNRMQRFLDAATSRDFSVLVLVLAVLGKLQWFLWMAAVGSHGFWIALLVLQSRVPRPAAPGEGR